MRTRRQQSRHILPIERHAHLSLEDIARFAPSAVQRTPHPRVSDRYQPFPTIDLVQEFMKDGWYPVQAVEVKVRNHSMQGYQKHMVRMEHPDCMISKEEFLQLLITQAINGLEAYELSLGVWRLICSNGMVVGDEFCSTPKIKHIGHTLQDVIDVSAEVISQAPSFSKNISVMKLITLTEPEREIFAESAAQLILPEDGSQYLDPSSLLLPNRHEDQTTKNTLWTTFNTVQENITKGHVMVKTRDDQGCFKSERKTKAIRSIDRSLHLNKALWTLTEAMKELKG